MKAAVLKKTEINVKFLKVHLPVRYDDEDISYDFPLRTGDCWDATIDIDSGKILEWPEGKSGDMYMKLCDEGNYYLLDINKTQLACIEQDYVPNGLIPPHDGYGDYIHFQIDENGVITNWYKNPSVEQFFYNSNENS